MIKIFITDFFFMFKTKNLSKLNFVIFLVEILIFLPQRTRMPQWGVPIPWAWRQ